MRRAASKEPARHCKRRRLLDFDQVEPWRIVASYQLPLRCSLVSVSLAAMIVFALGFIVTRGYPRINAIGQSVGYSTLALAFALLVLASACADRQRVNGAFSVLRGSWLRILGIYSYAVYLFHKPLHDLAASF